MGERAWHSAGDAGWDGVVARFESVLLNVIRDSAAAEELPLGMLRTPVA
jgi:hypothetical protein